MRIKKIIAPNLNQIGQASHFDHTRDCHRDGLGDCAAVAVGSLDRDAVSASNCAVVAQCRKSGIDGAERAGDGQSVSACSGYTRAGRRQIAIGIAELCREGLTVERVVNDLDAADRFAYPHGGGEGSRYNLAYEVVALR